MARMKKVTFFFKVDDMALYLCSQIPDAGWRIPSSQGRKMRTSVNLNNETLNSAF